MHESHPVNYEDFHHVLLKVILYKLIFSQEMKVSTAWRARHASMIPLFMDTQTSSDSSLRSLTQSSEAEDEVDGPRGVAATQANVFSATQQTGTVIVLLTPSVRLCLRRCHDALVAHMVMPA